MTNLGFEVLDPGPAREARIAAAVRARLERAPRSLLAELLDVLAARPLRNGAWAFAAAAIALVSTPAGLGLSAWRALGGGDPVTIQAAGGFPEHETFQRQVARARAVALELAPPLRAAAAGPGGAARGAADDVARPRGGPRPRARGRRGPRRMRGHHRGGPRRRRALLRRQGPPQRRPRDP